MPGKLDIAPSEAARPRWGLFAVSALAAFLLVATALWSWVGAREAASHLTEARALTLTTSVSRALRNREDAVQPTLDGLLDDHFDDGLRYVALIRGERLVGAAGEPATAVEPKDIARRPRLEEIGDRVRAVGPLRERRPGARRRAGRQGPAADSAVVAPARRDTSGLPAILVLEVEPTVARALQTRALTGLALALAVAALLMGAAAAFWRLGRRAEAAEAALQRQRHLAALGEMSAVLGHELRNPLASLKGHAQLLEERLAEDTPERRKAARVVGEAERLERLIEEVLAFVRSGAVQTVRVAPAELAEAAVEAVRGAHPGAVIEVDLRAAPASWSLDPRRIERVLVNLIDNAVKSTDPTGDGGAHAGVDGPSVQAATPVLVRVTGDARRLVFSVRDHGPGVPPGDLDRIFEPFATTRTKGTGLGLAIARRIAEAHGGTLSASNPADGGALFALVIPAAPATPGASA